MATEDNSGIGGRKARLSGESGKYVALDNKKKVEFEANKKKKKEE